MNTAANRVTAIDDAVWAAAQRYTQGNPLSHARHERACRVLPAGHSRQTLFYSPFPLTITRAAGARLSDLDGHDYLNLVGDYAAGVLGHTCEPVQHAVREALANGLSLSGVNSREVELAELISQRIPSMQQLRFCNSGSEACLFSALLALHVTRRPKLLVFNGCYHGGFMVYGANDPPLSIPFALLKATYNDVPGTRALLRAHATSIAAVFVEPMMGAAGCIPAAPEFLRMLRDETRAHGALLIMDEVMSSRLGPGGAQGLYGIDPDVTTLGKFWGGGFAFGAFGGSRAVMQHFDTRGGGVLSQAGTFNNNIVAMSAGLAGARDVYTPAACIALNRLGDDLRTELNAVGRASGVPMQATGLGAVMNLHWHNRLVANPGDVEPLNSPARRLFHLEMTERGYYVASRGMITLSLPVSAQDLSGFLEAVRGYLAENGALLRSAQQ